MSFDLTNKNISDTFQNLLQKTGSDGRLYDLQGNQVRDLRIDGTLIANSYVTSQSLTLVSSGSNIFGNSADDTHQFTGSLIASGNLVVGSASQSVDGITVTGDISASGNFYLGGRYKQHLIFDTNTAREIGIPNAGGGNVDGQDLTIYASKGNNESAGSQDGGNILLYPGDKVGSSGNAGEVRVKGNISASGNLYLEDQQAVIFDTRGHVSASDNLNLYGSAIDLNAATDTDVNISEGGNGWVKFDGSTHRVGIGDGAAAPPSTLTVKGAISSSGFIKTSKFISTLSHITASGNISSSGKGIFDTIDVKSSITGSYPKLTDSAGNTIFKISGLVESNNGKIEMGDVDNVATGEVLILDANNETPIFYTHPNANVKWGINNNPQNSINGLTVAGDISASGQFFSLSGSGHSILQTLSVGTPTQPTNMELTIEGSISASGHLHIIDSASFGTNNTSSAQVTVEGDISSSGDLYIQSDKYIYFAGEEDTQTFIRESSNDLTIAADDDLILDPDDSLVFQKAGSTKGYMHGGTGYFHFGGTAYGTAPTEVVTVTGNISASGNLYVGSVDGAYISGSQGNLEISGSGAAEFTVAGNISSSKVLIGAGVSGSVDGLTVAGDISASGDLNVDDANNDVNLNTFNTSTLGGSVRVTGDISASGDLYLQDNQSIHFDDTSGGHEDVHIQKLDNGRVTVSGSATGLLIDTKYGNVGVGAIPHTDSAGSGLTVAGDISASGGVYVNQPEHAIGAQSINYGTAPEITGSLYNTNKGYGDIVSIGTSSVYAGRVYCLDSSGETWTLADANSGCISSSLLGVSLAESSSKGMLIRGFTQVSQSLLSTAGQKVYASTHTGSISGSVPQGSGHIVRVLGYALNTGTSNMSSSIYFNPDNTWITLV